MSYAYILAQMLMSMQQLDEEIIGKEESSVTEQNLAEGVEAIYTQIKIGLLKKHMSQVELANLIGEGPQQLSRAIHGDMQPKSKEIRQKIYRFLDIKG